MRRTIRSVLAAIAASSAAVAGANNSVQEYELKIGRQPIRAALTELAEQADFNVSIIAKAVDHGDVVVGPFQGRYTVDAALDTIMAETGLTYVRVNETTIALVEKSSRNVRLARLDTGAESGATMAASRSASERGSGRKAVDLDGNLEEVIVSAQRREEQLQDVPISISVFSGKSLESGAVSSLNDALHTVPGFAGYENTQGGMTKYSVRGVSTNTSLFNSSSVVGYYMDEIPFAFVRFPVVPDANAYDLQRVEALRGPQGTLYGASSLNGVIRVVTEDADFDEFELKARTGLSSTQDGDASYRGDVAANLPLIDGKLAFRVVGGYQDEGGWIDLPLAGVKDANDRQTKNLRVKMNAQPTEELGIEFMNWFSRTHRGYSSSSRDDRTSVATYPSPTFNTNFDAHGLILSYEFPSASLVSSTSRMGFDSSGLEDGLDSDLIARTGLEADLLSQEIRLSSISHGPWKWSAGGIYRDEEDKLIQEVFVESTLAAFSQVPTRQLFDSSSYAFFGEISRSFFGGKLELAGGLRYFHDTNSSDEVSAYSFADGSPVTPAGKSVNVKSDALTPRVIISYHPSETTSLYASFGEGFRAGFAQGGFVLRDVSPDTVPFLPVVKPDKLRNYEIGAKGSAFDGLLSYDLAIYYIDWKDAVQVQLVVVPPRNTEIFTPLNSEGIDGVGADAAITLRFSDRLQLGATISWNDLQFANSVLNGTDVLYPEGVRPPESSKMTAGGDIRYNLPFGSRYSVEFAAGVNYTSKLVTARASGLATGDDLLRASASLALASTSGWSATLFGDNLSDEDGSIRPVGALIPDESDRLRPRTIGLQLDYRF